MSNNNLGNNGEGGSNKSYHDVTGKGAAWRWWGFGIEFLGVLGIFTYGGWWADQKWGTSPWLMVSVFLVAFIGMLYLLFKESRNF